MSYLGTVLILPSGTSGKLHLRSYSSPVYDTQNVSATVLNGHTQYGESKLDKKCECAVING